MNVRMTHALIASLSFCMATELLTSSDLGYLFVKYAANELSYNEYKLIENVIRIYGHVQDGVQDVPKTFQCFLCRSAFIALTALIKIGVPDETLIDNGAELCSIAYSYRVCRGIIEQNLPVLKYIITTTPEATPKTFCGVWHQDNKDPDVCSYNDLRFEWQIRLPPKAKAQRNDPICVDSKPLKVAILSDIHIDPFYEPFGVAHCDEPVCCRKGQKLHFKDKTYIDKTVLYNSVAEFDEEIVLDTTVISDIIKTANVNKMEGKEIVSAGYWGDYRSCDTPIWAFVDVLKQISSHKDIDVVYYIGDSIDHHIWETTYKLNEDVNSLVVNKMKEIFSNDMLVVPTVGNHEAQPLNQFAPTSVKGERLNTTWLYKSLANKWSHYLTHKASDSMKQRGGFSMLIRPGLRVISINNNVAYKYNWWLVYDPHNAKRHLEWLVRELYKAELSGEKVHILSHIPPGDQDLIYTWTREYHRIVERFSSTITAQFNGHIHSDEFKIFYKEGKAFNVAWGAGSATTFKNLNLNYKIVTFNNKSFEPTSMINYIYNLTQANLTPYKRPCWHKLYDMQKSFQLQNLNATSMDQLVQEMVTNKKNLLDEYVEFSSKQSDAMPYCDADCKLEMLCNAVTTVTWERRKCFELQQLYFLSSAL